jgi:hypothetical protein
MSSENTSGGGKRRAIGGSARSLWALAADADSLAPERLSVGKRACAIVIAMALMAAPMVLATTASGDEGSSNQLVGVKSGNSGPGSGHDDDGDDDSSGPGSGHGDDDDSSATGTTRGTGKSNTGTRDTKTGTKTRQDTKTRTGTTRGTGKSNTGTRDTKTGTKTRQDTKTRDDTGTKTRTGSGH